MSEEEEASIPNDEECIISESADSDLEIGASQLTSSDRLLSAVNIYSAFMYSSPAEILVNGSIEFSIPRSFLPLSIQAAYGLLACKSLLDVHLTLEDDRWDRPPHSLKITNEIHGTNYIGHVLVDTICRSFFTPEYRPRSFYRCEPYLLTPTGQADDGKLAELVSLGYDQDKAKNALVLCGNDKEQAVEFLRTGAMKAYVSQIEVEYRDSPLLYFVLEIAECFLDLSDHCCICRAPLEPGVKPSVCNKDLCKFQYMQLGIGSSLYQEIKNNPLVVDLMVSVFGAAVDTQFLTPAPLGFRTDEMSLIVSRLPPIESLVTRASNDRELREFIGAKDFELLRWIVMSNRSHLIHLQHGMRIFESSIYQFMSLISAPEVEREFKRLKARYGSRFLFHGSSTPRWHSIIRNGLKNASGTDLQANGAVHGAGIYFAPQAQTSLGYSVRGRNNYRNSVFGRDLQVLALCEVCRDPSLKSFGWALTLQNEAAVICRFLLVIPSGVSFSFDMERQQIGKIPGLRDVLTAQAVTASKVSQAEAEQEKTHE